MRIFALTLITLIAGCSGDFSDSNNFTDPQDPPLDACEAAPCHDEAAALPAGIDRTPALPSEASIRPDLSRDTADWTDDGEVASGPLGRLGGVPGAEGMRSDLLAVPNLPVAAGEDPERAVEDEGAPGEPAGVDEAEDAERNAPVEEAEEAPLPETDGVWPDQEDQEDGDRPDPSGEDSEEGDEAG